MIDVEWNHKNGCKWMVLNRIENNGNHFTVSKQMINIEYNYKC